MNSKNYWVNRKAQRMYQQMGIAEEASVEIGKHYTQASNNLQKQLQGVFERYQGKHALSEKEARRLLNTIQSPSDIQRLKTKLQTTVSLQDKAELKKFIEAPAYAARMRRLEELQGNIDMVMKQMYGVEANLNQATYQKILEDGYYHGVYDLQQRTGKGFSFSEFSKDEYERVVNTKFLGKNYSDRIWKNTQEMATTLKEEMAIGVLSGRTEREMANLLSQKMEVANHYARRVIRTESAFRVNEVDALVYSECGLESYIILATLDLRTSEVCQKQDLKEYKLKNKKVGVNYPPFHPYCRTVTMANVSKEELQELSRKARDPETGHSIDVPGDVDYKEWKDSLVPLSEKGKVRYKIDTQLFKDRTRDLKKEVESDINKLKEKFIPASNIKEAEEYARTVLGVENVSYKGCDIETANAWNEGLKDSFDRFPELKNNFGFVGESHERNKMLKNLLEPYFINELKKAHPNAPISIIEQKAKEMTKKQAAIMKIKKGTLADSFANKSPILKPATGISVNRDFGINHKKFIEILKIDTNSKFHPVGCDTVRSVLDHEIGHQLDALLDISGIEKIKNLFDSRTTEELTEVISKYSWENKNKNRYSEMIAEAWAEYCNNPHPREIARTVGEVVESEYKRKFGG